MGTQAEKKRLVGGLPKRVAAKRLREIYEKEPHEKSFEEAFPRPLWKWMDVWFQLRATNPTLNVIAQAFAEKIVHSNKEKRALEQTIVSQRKELAKRYRELEDLKAIVAGGRDNAVVAESADAPA